MAQQIDLTAENALLKARIAQLEKEMPTVGVAVRSKIEEMSSEVVDTNPYRCVCGTWLGYCGDSQCQ